MDATKTVARAEAEVALRPAMGWCPKGQSSLFRPGLAVTRKAVFAQRLYVSCYKGVLDQWG